MTPSLKGSCCVLQSWPGSLLPDSYLVPYSHGEGQVVPDLLGSGVGAKDHQPSHALSVTFTDNYPPRIILEVIYQVSRIFVQSPILKSK